MKLTAENQDDMDCRPLTDSSSVVVSPETENLLAPLKKKRDEIMKFARGSLSPMAAE